MNMRAFLFSNPQAGLLLSFAVGALLPISAIGDENAFKGVNSGGGSQARTVSFLYEDALVHDQHWTMDASPADPDNQKIRAGSPRCPGPKATLLAAGLEPSIGSAVGPDGKLYVTEGRAGRISRVDPNTGEVTTFAAGLPKALSLVGGPMDIAFLGDTAYVLVTLVSPDVGGTDIDGIYRVDARTGSRSSRTSGGGQLPIHQNLPSSSRLACSMRWNPTVAAS
jgi:hypothetical protein